MSIVDLQSSKIGVEMKYENHKEKQYNLTELATRLLHLKRNRITETLQVILYSYTSMVFQIRYYNTVV